jgi:hypothetical protein
MIAKITPNQFGHSNDGCSVANVSHGEPRYAGISERWPASGRNPQAPTLSDASSGEKPPLENINYEVGRQKAKEALLPQLAQCCAAWDAKRIVDVAGCARGPNLVEVDVSVAMLNLRHCGICIPHVKKECMSRLLTQRCYLCRKTSRL